MIRVLTKCDIIEAINNNNIKFIKECIDNKMNVDITNDREGSILILAIERGYKEMTRLLINNTDININNNYNYGMISALHIACDNEDIETVDLLLKNGADTEITDNNYMRPIHYAAQKNNYEIIKLLINHKADINKFDNYNRLPIHLTSNTEITEYLLNNGSYINSSEYKIKN